MYSGTTLTKFSGRILGAHQKIDRVARHQLMLILPQRDVFPSIRDILHFEGKNGPDGIKRKSPSHDEPWHFYSPFDKSDIGILKLIGDHYNQLIDSLEKNNTKRAAFEAAWLAHALVDGLTPSHHYPYEQKLAELRGGRALSSRRTIKEKAIIPGRNKREVLNNNWKMWGVRGLLSTHWLFDFGASTIIVPLSLNRTIPTEADVERMRAVGIIEWFKQAALEIATLNMYEDYYNKGWTPSLARQVRTQLAPTIVKTVTLTWYMAVVDRQSVKLES
jgi:hypothetical protein